MKKGIIVLLIAVLVAGFAFADFSGDAYVQFKGDLDAKDYGFVNGTEYGFTFEFVSESADIKGEESIHVELAASVKAVIDNKYGAKGTDIWASTDYDTWGTGLLFKIKTAKVVGSNWYVSVLGVHNVYDYAKAAALVAKDDVKDVFGNKYYYTTKAASYSVPYFKAPGVEIGYDGFTASVGLYHNESGTDNPTATLPPQYLGFYPNYDAVAKTGYKEGTGFTFALETKEFKFSDDAVAVQAAAEVSKNGGDPMNAGASAKATVAIQNIKVGVAADFGLEKLASDDADPVFGFDARVDFTYDFVTVNVYTAVKDGAFLKYTRNGGASELTYENFYLEAKAVFDLNAFELPLKVTATAKNIIEGNADAPRGIDLGLSAEYKKDAITAGASFNFNTDTTVWSGNVYGAYAAEKFTAGGNVSFGTTNGEDFNKLGLGVFAESDAIIKGARVGANYGYNDNAMFYGGLHRASRAANSNNFLADEAQLGQVGCYCIIEF